MDGYGIHGVVLIFVSLLCAAVISFEINPRVKTQEGYVRGVTLNSRRNKQFSAFLGIPYAEPPTGNLRFAHPVPKKPWEKTLMADTNGPVCPQFKDNVVIGNEDCLYLNVYTPWFVQENQGQLLPVLVYVSGGGFISGDGSSNRWSPSYIMDKNIVLILMNYRLGALGFLTTGDDAATGNFGMKDQVLALKWVQRNIRKFGGDPNRVTLAGHSAGGCSVHLHSISKMSKGLFHQLIPMSGNAFMIAGLKDPNFYYQYPKKIANMYNCPTSSSSAIIKCLRTLTVSQLVDTQKLFGDPYIFSFDMWRPWIEKGSNDTFLSEDPNTITSNNGMLDIPFMIGTVKDEALWSTVALYNNDAFYEFTTSNLDKIIESLLKFHVRPGKALVKIFKDFYFNGTVSEDRELVIRQITNFTTDVQYAYPVYKILQNQLRSGKQDFYMYNFQYRGTFSRTSQVLHSNRDVGVAHADEVTYFFPLKPSLFEMPDLRMSETDYEIVDLMIDLWTSFVINGFPTSSYAADPHLWKPYSKEKNYLIIGYNNEATAVPSKDCYKDRMDFWERHIGI